jgi:hypothetical protein
MTAPIEQCIGPGGNFWKNAGTPSPKQQPARVTAASADNGHSFEARLGTGLMWEAARHPRARLCQFAQQFCSFGHRTFVHPNRMAYIRWRGYQPNRGVRRLSDQKESPDGVHRG